MWLVLSVVVVLAAAVMVPLVLVNGKHKADNPGARSNPGAPHSAGPSAGGSGASGTEPWVVPRNDFGVGIINSYVTSDLLIVVTEDNIVAFEQDTGKERWRVSPPSAVGAKPRFCGAGSAVVHDRLAVSVGNDVENCGFVGVVDIATGKLLWQKPILPEGQHSASSAAPPVEIVGQHVVIGFENQIGAFSLARGEDERWVLSLDHKDQSSGQADSCPVDDLLSADDSRTVYFSATCLATNIVQFGAVDAQQKTLKGTEVTPEDLKFKPQKANLISVKPLVVLIRKDGLRSGTYVVASNPGQGIPAMIPGGTGNDAFEVSNTRSSLALGGHDRFRVVSDGSTLVTMTLLPKPGGMNKLVAFDLASGRQRWAVSLDGARIYMPIAVQDGNVLVAAGTDAGHGKLSLMRVDLATGKLLDTTQPNQKDPDVNGPNFGPFVQFVGGNDRAFGVWVQPPTNTPIPGPDVFSF